MNKKETKIDFTSLARETIENAREDREEVKELLKDLKAYTANGPDRHKETSIPLAKYVETLQRSNEQIAKIAALAQKNEEEDVELSDAEREDLFDQLSSDAKKTNITKKKK